MIFTLYIFFRTIVRRGESVGRCIREWPASPERDSAADRGAGAAGRTAMRHQPATAGLSRLREQDPREIQRDGLHPARSHRRQQAPRHHAERCQTH